MALQLRLRIRQFDDAAAAHEHRCESPLLPLDFHLVGYCPRRIRLLRMALRQVWAFRSLGSLSQYARRYRAHPHSDLLSLRFLIRQHRISPCLIIVARRCQCRSASWAILSFPQLIPADRPLDMTPLTANYASRRFSVRRTPRACHGGCDHLRPGSLRASHAVCLR